MTLPINLFAIISNTFTGTLRQPIYGVVLAATIGILIISPSLVMFTLDDDNQLLKDVCLSTLLIAGLLLGVFASASVVTEEIENKTSLTVLSKTVGRALFIFGKFIGIIASVLLAEFLLALVFFMVIRHGVMQTARDQHDTVVITLGSIAALVTFIVGLAGNYFYRWRFSSTAVTLAVGSAFLAVAVMAFLDLGYAPAPAAHPLCRHHPHRTRRRLRRQIQYDDDTRYLLSRLPHGNYVRALARTHCPQPVRMAQLRRLDSTHHRTKHQLLPGHQCHLSGESRPQRLYLSCRSLRPFVRLGLLIVRRRPF